MTRRAWPAPVPYSVAANRRRCPHLREVGALERRAVDDRRHVGEQALRFQGGELGPGGDRVTGAPVPVPHALGEVQQPGVDLTVRHPREQARERGPAKQTDRPNTGLRNPVVEDVVVDVADQDAVALLNRRRALDRRLPAEQRRDLRILDDLAAQAESEVLGQHGCGVADQPGQLRGAGRCSGGPPLVAVRVWIGARLAQRRESVRGGRRPGVEVVLERMVVQVDQTWEEEILRAGVDDARIADLDALGRGRALPDGDDPSVPHQDAAVRNHRVIVVHRDDGRALEEYPAPRIPGCRLARRTSGGSRRDAAEQEDDDERDPGPSSRCGAHRAPTYGSQPGRHGASSATNACAITR